MDLAVEGPTKKFLLGSGSTAVYRYPLMNGAGNPTSAIAGLGTGVVGLFSGTSLESVSYSDGDPVDGQAFLPPMTTAPIGHKVKGIKTQSGQLQYLLFGEDNSNQAFVYRSVDSKLWYRVYTGLAGTRITDSVQIEKQWSGNYESTQALLEQNTSTPSWQVLVQDFHGF